MNKRGILNEQQRNDFAKAAKPLMKFLANPKMFHPHFTVILDSTRAELVEGCVMIRNDGPIIKDPGGLMCDKCWDKEEDI